MKYMLRIFCRTPPGKAKKCSKSFGMQYFSALKKPIETKIISDSKFSYVYSYDKQKERYKIIEKKIPKAEISIRSFYTIVISLTERGNKLAKKGAWTVEKMKRWIMKQLRKKVADPKAMEDFIDAVELTDKKELMEFLSEPIFSIEEWEVNK